MDRLAPVTEKTLIEGHDLAADPSSWALRLDVADTERLDALSTGPLPLGLRQAGTQRHAHRDIYFDTPEGDLEARGTLCRVRIDPRRGRLLELKIRSGSEKGGVPYSGAHSAPLLASDIRTASPEESDAARTLHAMVDPARLLPVLEMETDRRVRTASWWWLPRPCFELAFDTVTAPGQLLPRILEMIQGEAGHARAGRPGRIRAKLNGLDDPEVIRALYEASRAGVQIDLIVRGICRLIPGVPGVSENIRVISILGPLLEHGRAMHFGNGGADRYFIGSADWRSRNLRRRVEVFVPVEGAACVRRLDTALSQELEDPTAWEFLPDEIWRQRSADGGSAPGVQEVRLG